MPFAPANYLAKIFKKIFPASKIALNVKMDNTNNLLLAPVVNDREWLF